jgi:malonyl-CoA O-methyltransferase
VNTADRPSATGPLSPAEGYRRWAPTYAAETVVSALEDRVVGGLRPDLEGRRLLDAGCGIGRRVHAARGAPALAVGLDLVPQMLLAGTTRAGTLRVAGDVSRLPFMDGSFDLLWCRLVLGHVADLVGPYREMARVARRPAALVVSDFHARAVAAGHRRSFRDGSGALHEIEHHVHEAARHVEAARSAGWTLVEAVDAPAGAPERDFYERAGRLAQFEREAELPLVLVMSFER